MSFSFSAFFLLVPFPWDCQGQGNRPPSEGDGCNFCLPSVTKGGKEKADLDSGFFLALQAMVRPCSELTFLKLEGEPQDAEESSKRATRITFLVSVPLTSQWQPKRSYGRGKSREFTQRTSGPCFGADSYLKTNWESRNHTVLLTWHQTSSILRVPGSKRMHKLIMGQSW